jgi:hypothetical protein
MESNKNYIQENGLNQNDLMNRVNQTFEKISQDVKKMIEENKQQSDNHFADNRSPLECLDDGTSDF